MGRTAFEPEKEAWKTVKEEVRKNPGRVGFSNANTGEREVASCQDNERSDQLHS